MNEEFFNTFSGLIKQQFEYGAKKYAKDGARESTDLLFDSYGANWVYGTMAKYCFRYSNTKREKDILKIATYAYLLWLKRGFHESESLGADSPRDTNIDLKINYFRVFTKACFNHALRADMTNTYTTLVLAKLEYFSRIRFELITAKDLYDIYLLSFIEYTNSGFINNPGADADTGNV